MSGGLHPESEMAGQATTAPRRLLIEWVAQLYGGPFMIAAGARCGGSGSLP